MQQKLEEYIKEGLICSQRHPQLPLTIYNYTDKTQWEGLWDEITLNTRGLVLDDKGNVVARPFKKFFNLSENKTQVTDDYVVYQKYDGSLGILFYYAGEWVFCSRGSFTSEQAVKGREILNIDCDYDLLNKANTYCFEIIYPENKIVCNYGGSRFVILTGVFNTQNGEEQKLHGWNLPYASSFSFDSPLRELEKHISDKEEGYVIRFDNGERCKIKGVEYLRLHKTMSEMSSITIWETLKDGKSVLDVIYDFPDEFFQTVKDYENELKISFFDFYYKIKLEYKDICVSLGKCDDKIFATSIKDYKSKHFFFNLRKGMDINEMVWKAIKPRYRAI